MASAGCFEIHRAEMAQTLAVVDYGLGNLRSICAALERLEVSYECTSDERLIRDSKGLIIPGVGAFPDGMKNLRRLGLVDLLEDLVRREEATRARHLSRIPADGARGPRVRTRERARVARQRVSFESSKPTSNIRIPHNGWNDCVRTKDSPIFADIPPDALFYFTHSYHVECFDDADVTALSDHGHRFVAAIQRGHIFGTQFHPEKSQSHGLALLRNFAHKVVAEC